MIKKLIVFTIIFVSILQSNAQVYKKILPASAFSESLSKIVLDFRNNFATIKGLPEPKEVGVDRYESLIKLPGSEDDHISVSHSIKDPSATFQAIMYQGEDYEKAAQIYKNCFTLIKKTRVKWVDKSLNNFKGTMETPNGLNFTISYLTVEIQDERYKDFVTEVELVNTNFSNWEVHINMSKKKLDAEITPTN